MDYYDLSLKSSDGSKGVPEATYTRFGEKIRQAIPGPMQCQMGCGGRNCKWENPSRWNNEDQVIKGVFSSWVIEDVVAMSRPSTEVIDKYDLIKQFKDKNICSIINLQRPGEHASCGPPLEKESLFTYKPQRFMDNNIFFYNFGWKDYGVASLGTILDMVKVMSFALLEGRVAVHCHAGLGRTGVLIACYLVYAYRMDADSAIITVRKGRPKSIQTRGQIACIKEFAQFLKPLRIVFPQVVPHAERLTLLQFLHRQRHLLHGMECRELRYTPKIVKVVCQRLEEIATTCGGTKFPVPRARLNTLPKPRRSRKKRKEQIRRSNTLSEMKDTLPGAFLNEHLNLNNSTENIQDVDCMVSSSISTQSDQNIVEDTSHSSANRASDPTLATSTDAVLDSKERLTTNNVLSKSEQPKSPILVASASSSRFVTVSEEDDDQFLATEGKTKPQVVLVKQGSRSGLISVTASQLQDTTSILDVNNLNNNNQIVPSLPLNMLSSKITIRGDDKALPRESSKEPLSLKIEDFSDTPKSPSLPSATPSSTEPTLSSSRQASPRKPEDSAVLQDLRKAGGDEPSIRKVRLSAGRSHNVMPSGMPDRTVSGKGKKKIHLPSESNENGTAISSSSDGMTENNSQETTEIADKLCSNSEAKIEDVADVHGETKTNRTEDAIESGVESVMKTDQEDLDRELDEIIVMKDDDGPFLSEAESDNDENALSHSITSKLSWNQEIPSVSGKVKHDKQNDENSEQGNSLQVSVVDDDQKEGSRTPLTDRGERNMEQTVALEDTAEGSTEDNVAMLKELENENGSVFSHSTDSLESTKNTDDFKESAEKECEKSQTQSVKSLPVRKLTQSLVDLRSYDSISLSSFDLGSPLSPGSKSSSSEDVRTPGGSASSKKRIKDPITVAMALSYKLTDNEWLWEKVYTRQVELNTRVGAWSSVEQELDAHLLSSLMWSWIEHLSKPVLSPADVKKLMTDSRPDLLNSTATDVECPNPMLFDDALVKLGKAKSSTVQCVLRCLLSLPPLSFELETSVVRRVMTALTHNYLLEEAHESEDYKNLIELISLTQNYLVKMRSRRRKKEESDCNRLKEARKISNKDSSEPGDCKDRNKIEAHGDDDEASDGDAKQQDEQDETNDSSVATASSLGEFATEIIVS